MENMEGSRNRDDRRRLEKHPLEAKRFNSESKSSLAFMPIIMSYFSTKKARIQYTAKVRAKTVQNRIQCRIISHNRRPTESIGVRACFGACVGVLKLEPNSWDTVKCVPCSNKKTLTPKSGCITIASRAITPDRSSHPNRRGSGP